MVIWLQIVGYLLRLAATPDWNEIMTRILSPRHDRVTSILLRLAFQVTIYYIWRERNKRRHTQKTRPAQQFAKLIDKIIRQTILSTRYHEKRGLQGLLQRWISAHFEKFLYITILYSLIINKFNISSKKKRKDVRTKHEKLFSISSLWTEVLKSRVLKCSIWAITRLIQSKIIN